MAYATAYLTDIDSFARVRGEMPARNKEQLLQLGRRIERGGGKIATSEPVLSAHHHQQWSRRDVGQ